MLEIKTAVKESPGRGLGLFAGQLIRAKTVCWRHDAAFDRVISKWELDRSTPEQKEFAETYGCLLADGSRHICMDNARFINHSETGANVRDGENAAGFYFFAMRDIQPGEEILTNYNEICADCEKGLGFKPHETIR